MSMYRCLIIKYWREIHPTDQKIYPISLTSLESELSVLSYGTPTYLCYCVSSPLGTRHLVSVEYHHLIRHHHFHRSPPKTAPGTSLSEVLSVDSLSVLTVTRPTVGFRFRNIKEKRQDTGLD